MPRLVWITQAIVETVFAVSVIHLAVLVALYVDF